MTDLRDSNFRIEPKDFMKLLYARMHKDFRNKAKRLAARKITSKGLF